MKKPLISHRMHIVLAFLLLTLLTILLARGLLFSSGTILYGDFISTLTKDKFIGIYYPTWTENGEFNLNGFTRLAYLSLFSFPFYVFNIPGDIYFKLLIVSTLILSGFSMYVLVTEALKKRISGKELFFCGIISAVLYAFNPWVMNRIQHRFMLVSYSILPLIILFSFKALKDSKLNLKYTVIAAILFTLASTDIHSIVFTSIFLFSLFMYLFFSLNQRKQITFNAIFLLTLYFAFSLYWILPSIVYSSSQILQPPTVSTIETVHLLSRNSNMLNVLELTSYWNPKIIYSDLILGIPWGILSLAIPILCFSILLFYRKSKAVASISLLGIAIMFLYTGTSTFSLFYEQLCFNKLPLISTFGWLFRDPDKWGFLLSFIYSFMIGLAFAALTNKFSSKNWKPSLSLKIRRYLIQFFVLASVMLFTVPVAYIYLNQIITPVTIPNEFYTTNEWLANDSAVYKVLWLPKYTGSGTTWAPDSLIGPFDLYSSEKSSVGVTQQQSSYIYGYILSALSNNKTNVLGKYLNAFNIRYVIFHNDTIRNPENPMTILRNLENQLDLELVRQDGVLYIFENKNWSEAVSIPSQHYLVVGGINILTSTTSVDNFRLENSAVTFLENGVSKIPLDSNYVITNSNLDRLAFFLTDTNYVIAPFDYTNNHDPSYLWSKAATQDPLHGEWHPYLEEIGIENWDFDYGKGLVFTTMPSTLKENPAITNDDLVTSWSLNSLSDINQWKNYTVENPSNQIYSLTLDNNALKAELLNSTWGWKTINSPLIPAEYSNFYRLELQIKGENAYKVHIKILEYDQDNKVINAPQVKSLGSGNFDWNSITLDYTPENQATKYIQLQIWHGSETTQPLPNKIWVKNVKIYNLQRFTESITLEMPFALPETNQYIFLTRLFQNQQGGKIQIQIDNKNYTINTKDQLNKFAWEQIDTLNLQKGQHKIILTNLEGFNAVNLFTLIPKQQYQAAQNQIEENLQNKRTIYILEAETDLYHENTETSNKYSGQASNGIILEFDPTSKVYNEIEIQKPGNYTIALRSKGNLNIAIDQKLYKTNQPTLHWTYIGPIYLDKGKHKIETATSPTYYAQWNFENNESQGWTGEIPKIQTLSIDTNFYEGTYSLKAELNSSTKGWKTLQSPLLTVTPETAYSWDFYIAGENAHKAHIKIVEYDQNQKVVNARQVKSIGSGNFNWTHITFDYAPSENATYINLQIWHGSETTQPLPNKIWIDSVKVQGYSVHPSELDVIWLYSTQTPNETLNDIFTATENPAEIIGYQKSDSTKYVVKASAKAPFMLSFSEGYDPLWSAYVNGQKINSIPLYSVTNGFWINQTGTLEITIEYEPQKWFYYGLIISVTTLIACATYLTYNWTKGKLIRKQVKTSLKLHLHKRKKNKEI